jgi:hypothetical protein
VREAPRQEDQNHRLCSRLRGPKLAAGPCASAKQVRQPNAQEPREPDLDKLAAHKSNRMPVQFLPRVFQWSGPFNSRRFVEYSQRILACRERCFHHNIIGRIEQVQDETRKKKAQRPSGNAAFSSIGNRLSVRLGLSRDGSWSYVRWVQPTNTCVVLVGCTRPKVRLSDTPSSRESRLLPESR